MKITPPKKILIAKGWTQRAIAKATGRSRSEIAMVLNGRRFTCSVQEDIARVTGIPVEELFGEWTWSRRSAKTENILTKIDKALSVQKSRHDRAVMYACTPSCDYSTTHIGDGITHMLGYEPWEFTRSPSFWADRIHPEDAPLVFDKLKLLSEKGYCAVEYRFLHKDSTYRWMYHEMKLVRDEAGRALEIVGYWTDIARHNEAEEHLDYAQSITHTGSWEWDVVRNETFCSDEAYRLLGLKPWQLKLTYETFLDLVHPEDREFVDKSHHAALYEGKHYSIDFRIIRPDGSVRFVHSKAEIIFDETGKPLRMIGMTQDITAHHKEVWDKLRSVAEAFRDLAEILCSLKI